MSGGSFNYLYSKDSDQILDAYMNDLTDMIYTLSSCYDSPIRRVHVDKLSQVRDLLRACEGLIKAADVILDEDTMKVIKAVEWHRSADIGKEDVESLLDGDSKSQA